MADGDRPRALSPSQIRAWRRCQRAWAYRYIDGVEVDSNRFAQMGTRVHAVLEKWLSTGEAPDIETDEGRIAAAGLKHLPPPSDKLDVEAHVVFPRSADIEYHGYCDLIDVQPDEPEVTDHKSTVSFKWAKTEDELREDVQAIIYAAAVLYATKADAVLNKWVYYRTRGKAASKLVQVRMTRDDIEQAMLPIDATALDIYAARKVALPAAETPYDARACDMFGGCVYRDMCDLSPIERIRSIMAKTDLAEKMRRRKAVKEKEGGAPPAPKEEKKPTINAPEKKGTGGQSIADKMRERKAKQSGTADVDAVTGQTSLPVDKERKTKREHAFPGLKKDTPAAEPGKLEDMEGFRPDIHAANQATNQAARGSFVLFINCAPMEPHPYVVMRAADVMRPAAQVVEKHENVPDYRMVEYGKGPGMLAAALRDHLTHTLQLGSSVAILLNNHTDEGRHAEVVFESFAGLVIRGL